LVSTMPVAPFSMCQAHTSCQAHSEYKITIFTTICDWHGHFA
jgi:hypothetical protein